MTINDPAAVRKILETGQTIAVVGLSSNPARPSHSVAKYLQSVGYRIIPVNPNEQEVLGERSHANLDEVADPIDGVLIFRRSDKVEPIVEQAIARGARFVWMQEGVRNDVAAQRASAAGLLVVMDRCMLKAHRHFRA